MSIYTQKQNNDSSQNDSQSGSDGDYEEDTKIKTTPDAGFTGELRTVFGNENQWGQSLGIGWENAKIEDGVLYKHSEKDEYKLFSWAEIIGAHPSQYDRQVSADEPNQYYTKDYNVTQVQYEFVGARIAETPELDDEGNSTGEILCEESTAGGWEIGNAIIWASGNTTPNPASKTLAKLLTKYGNGAVIEEEEAEARGNAGYNDDGEFQHVYDWLTDTSNENVAREDLVGRELRFYKENRKSDQSDNFFHHPIVEDVKTGKSIRVQSSSDDGQEGESEAEGELDGTPEPIQDYLNTVGGMEANETLARSLLDDMVEEADNNLTAAMVEDYGGEQALINEVVGQTA